MALSSLNKFNYNTGLANSIIELYSGATYDELNYLVGHGELIGKLYCIILNASFMSESYNRVEGRNLKGSIVFNCQYIRDLSVEDLLGYKVKYNNSMYSIVDVRKDESTKVDMELECKKDD